MDRDARSKIGRAERPPPTRRCPPGAPLEWGHVELGRAGGPEQHRDFDQSIEAFIQAIELLPPNERETPLLEDAQHGLIEAYCWAGDPHRAWAIFERAVHGETGRLRSTIDMLAHAYFREHRYRESMLVLRDPDLTPARLGHARIELAQLR